MWEVILDALKDSALATPFLLIIYLLIEYLETNKKARDRTVKLLNGKLAPLVAGGVGLIPQCGFSVMATDLYCQNFIRLGTLIAFFVATSDEALPILFSKVQTMPTAFIVLGVKAVYAVALGYIINIFDKKPLADHYDLQDTVGCCNHDLTEHTDEHADENEDEHLHSDELTDTSNGNVSCDSAAPTATDSVSNDDDTHKHSSAQKFWNFVKHPLLHTLKLFVYIFVVNTVFGLLLFYAEEPILNFTSKLGFFQCFFTALIGLIPNCASSVILTGMYTEHIVTFSAMLAGLVANSGIALAILFKQRKPKRNFGIVGIMYAAGVILGIAAYFIEMLF